MKRFGLALIIFFWLFISASVDGQKEIGTESLQIFEERIGQYEQIMDRYFRQNPVTTAQNTYKSAVDKYNARVQAITARENHRKSEIDKKKKSLEKLEKRIGDYFGNHLPQGGISFHC